MLAVVGIGVVSLLIALVEVPRLIRQQMRKELWVFITLMILAAGLSSAKALDMKIPNPLDWIAFVYKPVSDVILGFLK